MATISVLKFDTANGAEEALDFIKNLYDYCVDGVWILYEVVSQYQARCEQ